MLHCSPNIKCPQNSSFLLQTDYIRRAGIIPFMIDADNVTWILLGYSKEKNPVWADLGGRSEFMETTLGTALREFNEESRGVLGIDLKNTTKIIITGKHKPRQVILIVQVETNPKNINIDNYFQKTLPKNKYEDEMQFLKWIKYEDFMKMKKKTLSKSLIKVRNIFKR